MGASCLIVQWVPLRRTSHFTGMYTLITKVIKWSLSKWSNRYQAHDSKEQISPAQRSFQFDQLKHCNGFGTKNKTTWTNLIANKHQNNSWHSQGLAFRSHSIDLWVTTKTTAIQMVTNTKEPMRSCCSKITGTIPEDAKYKTKLLALILELPAFRLSGQFN